MQKMILLDKNNEKLFVGTKQNCMHFVKSKKLPKGTYTMQPYIQQTVIGVDVPPMLDPKTSVGWFNRVFKK